MQQENAKRMGVDMCEGNKNVVETSFMEWLLNPSEVIIVRPILQWVDFEHSTRYFGRIAGVCETHGCLSLVMGRTSSERAQPCPSVGCGSDSGLFCFFRMKPLNFLNFSKLQF